jgi:hypothetical protein
MKNIKKNINLAFNSNGTHNKIVNLICAHRSDNECCHIYDFIVFDPGQRQIPFSSVNHGIKKQIKKNNKL